MASSTIKAGIQRTAVTLGMTLILIGVVLLSVSDRVFILGLSFLGVGCFLVLCYLIVTVSSCIKKVNMAEEEETQTETETRNTRQPPAQPEIDGAQFEAPRYEDVILYGSATVWTVTLRPGMVQEPEPPPYCALPQEGRRPGNMKLHPTTLLRISSDIHEFKGVITGERCLEPLTPPPEYSETVVTFDDVFEPAP
ncbi:transmembrane protein 139 [Discoglossus pictus]